MEDGILIGPAPYSAPAVYYFPLVHKMESVEVFKGPSAIPYGPNNIGGAINLITKQIPETEEGQIEVGLGAFEHRKLYTSYGDTIDDLGFLILANQQQSDGFKELPNGANTGFQT